MLDLQQARLDPFGVILSGAAVQAERRISESMQHATGDPSVRWEKCRHFGMTL